MGRDGNLRALALYERAVEFNPDNRFLARNEPSFDRLRGDDAVQMAVQVPAAAARTAG